VSVIPSTVTFADDGSAGADAAWSWLTALVWPGWRFDVVRTASARGPRRIAPSRCGLARLRTIDTPLAAATALLQHSGTGLFVVGEADDSADGSLGSRSTAVTLIADGHVPVLVARRGSALRSVLVVADGSPQADAAARVLAALPPAERAVATAVAFADAAAAAAERADSLRTALAGAGIRAGTRVLEPDPTVVGSRPAAMLQAEIGRRAPDLVVIGGRGTGPLARRAPGCLPLEVLRTAGCSVLVGPRHVP
jgi:nucleotide-binding universal stress UspA family protein